MIRFEIGSDLAETRISIVRIGTETTDDDVTDFLTDKSIILQNIRELQVISLDFAHLEFQRPPGIKDHVLCHSND